MADTRRVDTTPTDVYSARQATPVYRPQTYAGVTRPLAGPSSAGGEALPGWESDALIGTVLSGTYRLLRPLGEGGMGRVYEAQHTRIMGKRYAVKVLHPEHARNADVRARFQREAEAVAAIDHVNVVGVYDVNVLPDGRPFLVSELLRGRELGAYLHAQGRLSAAAAVAIVRQLCDALHAAHECGVIHRDVKPENVFLTGSPECPLVKVLDFGISRLEGQGGQKLTRTGVVMGTPCYMAPEQARGELADRRSDMYATGAILYRALAGRPPFKRADTMATLGAVLTEEPARLRAIVPDVPPLLELVVQRAMAREPRARYQHMQQLSEALAPYDVLPRAQWGSAGALPPAEQMPRRAREVALARPWLVVWLGAASAAVLLALMGTLAALIELWEGRPASGIEAALVVLGSFGVLATPLWLLVRWLRRHHWQNTANVLRLSRTVRRPVLLGLATSGMLALAIHALERLVFRGDMG
ncbi:MAG TPA: serine/threonine protein kinase, partial [Sorangium sp.]|nr:serine/threonine protein kinase [Sorangium sp.]